MMIRPPLTCALVLMLFGALVEPAEALSSKIRLAKPRRIFFYPQINFCGGYDNNEPGDGWGSADRSPRTQAALEWFGKSESKLQRRYTRNISVESWNLKFAGEYDPAEKTGERDRVRFKLLDTWIQFDTRRDRTFFRIGNSSIPYGHNPRMDPQMAFSPSLPDADPAIGFGRDAGVFFQTPLTDGFDLQASMTAGMGGRLDYFGSFFAGFRVGRPTFRATEWGVFLFGGELSNPAARRNLAGVIRIGADWVHKHKEKWRTVHQASVGENNRQTGGDRFTAHALNSAEWYIHPKVSVGLTHTFLFENLYPVNSKNAASARVFASASYSVARDARIRVHPFVEYRDSRGKKDHGVLMQACYGCGLIK